MHDQILQALNWRYATKAFDAAKKISDQDLRTVLEAARLAPSSFGIEAWKFLVVENAELRGKIRAVAFGQTGVTDASHLIVVARRTDARATIAKETVDRTAKTQGVDPSALGMLQQMLDGSVAGRSDAELDTWIRSQAYIPLGMMLETAALLGLDACPMEGFDPAGVDQILGLPAQNLKATAMLTLGYRSADDHAAQRPKTRRAFEEAVAFVK